MLFQWPNMTGCLPTPQGPFGSTLFVEQAPRKLGIPCWDTPGMTKTWEEESRGGS